MEQVKTKGSTSNFGSQAGLGLKMQISDPEPTPTEAYSNAYLGIDILLNKQKLQSKLYNTPNDELGSLNKIHSKLNTITPEPVMQSDSSKPFFGRRASL